MRSVPCQITKEISAQDLQELFNAEVVKLRKEQLEDGVRQPLPSMVMGALGKVMEKVIDDLVRNYPHGAELLVTYDESSSDMVELIAGIMARKPYRFSAILMEEG